MNVRAFAIGFGLLYCAGCGDKVPATQDGMLDKWKSAGLEVSAFAPTDGAAYGGGSCQAGQVAGLETTLCQHADATQAGAVREQALKKVGNVTGYALVNDRWLLVVADRKKVDPSGKTMNLLAITFQGRAAPAEMKK